MKDLVDFKKTRGIYIFLVPNYFSIGGVQLYVNRRAKYVKSLGYEICFVASEFDDNILKKPDYVKVIINKYLNKPTNLLSKSIINAEINQLSTEIGESPVFFECFTLESSTWSEIFASHFSGKSLVYPMSEINVTNLRRRYFLDFLQFKYTRRELIGLSNVSNSIMFGKTFVDKANYYVNISFDKREVPSLKTINYSKNNDKFYIGTISRFDKFYVDTLIASVITLSHKRVDKNFVLVLIGDSINENRNINSFKNKYSNFPTNLEILYLGFIHPIGEDFYKSLNVFVGMGTALVSSICQGVPSIVIDPRNDRPTGFMGIETKNFAYSENNVYYELVDLVERLVNDKDLAKYYSIKSTELFKSDYEYFNCMKKIDEFIFSNHFDNKYFDLKKWNFYSVIYRVNYLLSNNKLIVNIYIVFVNLLLKLGLSKRF